MNRGSLIYKLTEEDRLTRIKWMHGMVTLYGCIALLVFGLIVLTKSSSREPDEVTGDQTLSVGVQPQQGNSGADRSGSTP
jgi:hypothetical protein